MTYLIILLYIALLSFLYEFSNLKLFRNFNKLFLFITLVSLAAFRYRIGGDTYNYMLVYELLPEISEISESFFLVKLQPLWLLLNGISKSISSEFYVFQIIHALLVNSIIFYFFNKHSRYFFTSILVYYFTFYGLYNFEILRESLAVCVFLLGFNFLLEKKWIKYFLVVIISFSFHYSALVLLLLPFFLTIKLTVIRLILLTILAVIANYFVINLISTLTGAGGLSQTLAAYIDYSYSIFGLLSIMLINIIYPFSVFKFNQKYKVSNNKMLALTKFYILGGVLSLSFYILFRTTNYFIPFFVICLVDMIHHVARSKLIKGPKIISAAIIFTVIFSLHTYRYFLPVESGGKSYTWITLWHPYHSIFNPVKDPDREDFYESYQAKGVK